VGSPHKAVHDACQLFCDRERRDLAAAYRFYCGKPHDHAHSAEYDARANAQVLDAQLSRYRDLHRTVPELHRQLTGADLGGWFRCQDGTIVLAARKHAGRPLTGVIERQPDCIRWLLSLALLEDTRHIIVTAMNDQADD
jgi:DNA polymerase-3 subunit epsilon